MRNFLSRYQGTAFLLMLVLLTGSMLNAACTRDKRIDTLRATITAVHAAQDGFIAWDYQHQRDLVDHASSRDDAQAKIAMYRASQQTIADGFAVVYRALAVAATQTDEVSLRAALAKAGDLITAIHTLAGDLK